MSTDEVTKIPRGYLLSFVMLEPIVTSQAISS